MKIIRKGCKKCKGDLVTKEELLGKGMYSMFASKYKKEFGVNMPIVPGWTCVDCARCYSEYGNDEHMMFKFMNEEQNETKDSIKHSFLEFKVFRSK